MSKVYLVWDGDNHKIGVAQNPEDRLRDMQVGNSQFLQLRMIVECHTSDAAVNYEGFLHKFFRGAWVRGEWFNLLPPDLHKILDHSKARGFLVRDYLPAIGSRKPSRGEVHDEFMGPKEIARFLRRSKSWLYEHRERGEFPFFKSLPGSGFGCLRSDLITWIRGDQEVKP